MEDPEFTDFWQLLGYRDAIDRKIQRAALPQRCSGPVRSIITLPRCAGWIDSRAVVREVSAEASN